MRILTSYRLAGTRSFRRAAGKLFDTYGVNLQNPDKHTMDIYTCPAGYSIVQADQSGAEALIVANIAPRKGALHALFEVGIKPHTYMAMRLFPAELETGDLLTRSPRDLAAVDGWKTINNRIKSSGKPYDIGKRVVHACCDAETEVLTPNGWVSISTKPSRILQFDADRYMDFVDVAAWHEYDYDGYMVGINGHVANQLVTPNHRIPYVSNGHMRIMPAWQFANMREGTRQLPICGTVYGADNPRWSDLMLRFAVAIQADGCYGKGYNVRFNFVKQRKINRLNEMLRELGHPLDWRGPTSNGSTYIDIRNEWLEEAMSFLTDGKCFSWTNTMSLSARQLKLIIDECIYWDGTHNKVSNRKAYFSMIRKNADVLEAAARMCGIGTTRSINDGLHILAFNYRFKTVIDDCPSVPYTGKVYCPTVPTGMFLMRRKGMISVTGNSNYRMGPNTFRTSALVQSGGKLVLSRNQCIEYLTTFKHTFPEVIDWQDEIEMTINRTRLLRNLFNHPRRFNRAITDGYVREAISFIPQSTVGEITRRAMILMQDYIDDTAPDWMLCSDKHDSAAVMVPDEHVLPAGRLLQSFMKVTLPGRFGEFVMNSEVQAGKNWKPFDPTDNPAGMKEIKV